MKKYSSPNTEKYSIQCQSSLLAGSTMKIKEGGKEQIYAW